MKNLKIFMFYYDNSKISTYTRPTATKLGRVVT